MSQPVQSNFADALRLVRKAKGMTQEDFDAISSRVYVSALERGVKQPTLSKVDSFAAAMHVHPLTLLALCYGDPTSSVEMRRLLDRVRDEMAALVGS